MFININNIGHLLYINYSIYENSLHNNFITLIDTLIFSYFLFHVLLKQINF